MYETVHWLSRMFLIIKHILWSLSSPYLWLKYHLCMLQSPVCPPPLWSIVANSDHPLAYPHSLLNFTKNFQGGLVEREEEERGLWLGDSGTKCIVQLGSMLCTNVTFNILFCKHFLGNVFLWLPLALLLILLVWHFLAVRGEGGIPRVMKRVF